MAKFLPKRFKNDLDKRLKPPPRPSLLDDETAWNECAQKRYEMRQNTLTKLMAYYDIEVQSKDKWQKLALMLAEHFVPAMHFQEKRGQSGKWDWVTSYALYILIEEMRAAAPKQKMAVHFSEAKKHVKGTILEGLITSKTKPKTVENTYHAYKASEGYKLMCKLEAKIKTPKALATFREEVLKGL